MYSKAGEIVQEVFSSLRTVLSLNGEKLEEKRYESKLKAASWSSIRKGAVSGLVTGWIHLIVITLGRNIINVGYVSPLFQSLEEARGASTPIFRLIDEEEKISMNEPQILQDSIACEGPINMNGDIQFDNINFAYPTRSDALVLRNLTLMARAGETIALVGSNGSGKSTCISLLLRFYEPLSGRITINNRSITDFNLKQFRQKIGVVSQEPILFATSIYENIRFGKQNATKTEIEEAARLANAHDFIMQLSNKYDTIVGESGVQLSGGRTTIVIAHRLTTIQNAHRIYVLHNGCVIEQGTHETLMSKEGSRYRDMMKAQQRENVGIGTNQTTSHTQVEDDDQNQISERSRHCSHKELDDRNQTFGAYTYEERRGQIIKYSLLFLLMGIVVLVIRFIQYTVFAISGSKLTERICTKAFAHYLRQEVAFFDLLENISGAIANRLSSDALAIQQMVGSRLGIIFESVAMSTYDSHRYVEVSYHSFKTIIKSIYKGASGRGKTTVIQLLERFYDPIQGRIYLDGVNIRNLNIQWLRSCLGLVNQEPVLFNMTIAENIAYGRENTSIEDIINAAIKANIHHFIQQLPEGYKTKVGMKGCQLSCGEKQRIALARTFIRQPKILLLDEATSAMDSYNEQIIQDALEKADTDDPTRTTLIISHRLSTIRPCDMICILDKGYIVEGGTHEDLMKRRGVYYEMIVRDCTS
ncbi:unnamed protein product [Rotaria sp. Silwood1]|nr:unnamed protein product [Rotaria sp. Silwood1]